MKILATLGLATAVAVISTAAFASDLPNRKTAPAPIVAPRIFSWNGVYAGLNGGYLGTSAKGSGSSITGDVKGGVFGLTAGYNAQMPNNVVLGVEGDYGMSNADSSTASGAGKIESLVTARARAGVAMDRLLPYVTAGYAGSNVKLSEQNSNKAFENGWTAGAGAEYAFSDNLSAKAEALYISLEKATLPDTGSKVGYDGGLYRVGLNYHF